MKRCCILISGNGSNLQAIINAVKNLELNLEIVVVISNKKGAYGLQRAKLVGIETRILIADKQQSREQYDQLLSQLIDSYKVDLIILAGFMRILSAKFVIAYLGKILNIHPSLLPMYPGLNTHQQVLDNEEIYHGCSVHYVIPKLDAGSVILHAKFIVDKQDDRISLQNRVHSFEHKIYPLAIKLYLTERLCLRNGKAYLDNKELPSSGLNFKLM